ncbi:response regulator [Rhizobium leguminosarum]|uniref:Response regulator n=1 Tax=Rhizobium leguminosarum TaxID=384 RepID=A0A6P0C6B5_RHILE|nr:response regulator transcription factor [Rhizobium leguminosarum]NEI96223.1 response regulator [Rhizobium leguminosarum]NEJ26244.1 response regulator [Rhizobium leguminosarum]NEJ83109.1 response regulator [Rhizobium leguminosarum]NEK54980.1 response regulator [Rhizobium leguminosarum]
MRILLIEDDEAIGGAVEYYMRAGGLAIDWAKTLSQAREYQSKGTYQLILLDVSLPDGSGIDYLRNSGARTPTIVMTGPREIDRINALNAGADFCMGKPFSMCELSNCIDVAVACHGIHLPQAIEIADSRIVMSSRRFYRDGKVVDLTAAEWLVLDSLLHRLGAAVSEDIIEVLRTMWFPLVLWGKSVTVAQIAFTLLSGHCKVISGLMQR